MTPTQQPTATTSAPPTTASGDGSGGSGGSGSSSSSDKDGLSGGAIAGIAISCLLILGVVAVVIVKKRKGGNVHQQPKLDLRESTEMVPRQPSSAKIDNPMHAASADEGTLKRSSTVVSMT